MYLQKFLKEYFKRIQFVNFRFNFLTYFCKKIPGSYNFLIFLSVFLKAILRQQECSLNQSDRRERGFNRSRFLNYTVSGKSME
jgi:hypothetical protein